MVLSVRDDRKAQVKFICFFFWGGGNVRRERKSEYEALSREMIRSTLRMVMVGKATGLDVIAAEFLKRGLEALL